MNGIERGAFLKDSGRCGLILLLGMAGISMAAGQDDFVLANLNIHHDKENWPAREAFMVEEFTRQGADVICLQEVLQHETLENQAKTLTEKLGWPEYVFSSFDAEGNVKRYGNAILSKYPILSSDWKKLVPENRYRTAVHAVIDFKGTPIDVYCTHLAVGKAKDSDRLEQVQDLWKFIEQTRKTDFCFVAGDFNADPESEEIQFMRGKMNDAYEQLHPNTLGYTTPVPHGGRGHQERIDYIFFKAAGTRSLDLEAAEITFKDPIPEGILPSDHYGVFARWRLPVTAPEKKE